MGIWNNPEMGQHPPGEAMGDIDDAYLQMPDGLGDDNCCDLILVFRGTRQRVGTCSFIISEDKRHLISRMACTGICRAGACDENAQGMIAYERGQGDEKVSLLCGAGQCRLSSHRAEMRRKHRR